MQSFEDWLRTQHRPNTIESYLRTVAQFTTWVVGEGMSLDSITASNITAWDVVRYRDYLQEKVQAKPTTVNVALAGITAWVAWAVATGQRPDNPVRAIRRVRDTNTEVAPKGLTDREQTALLREARKTRHPIRDETILWMLLQTGIRVGELCSLVWGDITVGERSGVVQVRQGKGNKARSIPLSLSARQALWRWGSFSQNLAFHEKDEKRWSWGQQHAQTMMQWISLNRHMPIFTS
jgi:site-specific recombinase XerD